MLLWLDNSRDAKCPFSSLSKKIGVNSMIENISLSELASWGNYILNTSWQKIYKVSNRFRHRTSIWFNASPSLRKLVKRKVKEYFQNWLPISGISIWVARLLYVAGTWTSVPNPTNITWNKHLLLGLEWVSKPNLKKELLGTNW